MTSLDALGPLGEVSADPLTSMPTPATEIPPAKSALDKVVASAAEAVADIPIGATLAVGGFGVSGMPTVLIEALLSLGVDELTVISNNAGIDGVGLGRLLEAGRIRRMVASYVGTNREFARRYLSGLLELELTPQGSLAERMRAGGAGIPAFYTPTGVDTLVADGGIPVKYDEHGRVIQMSAPKEVRTFTTPNGPQHFVLEEAIHADFSLVRAWRGDRHGNLVFRKTAQNFNPVVAMCGQIAIAEVEELVEPGEIDPHAVHTPGVFVHRVVPLTSEQAADRIVEKLRVRPAPPGGELG